MSKKKESVVYDGSLLTIFVTGVGSFERGVPTPVTAEQAERLSTHPDFKVVTDVKKASVEVEEE